MGNNSTEKIGFPYSHAWLVLALSLFPILACKNEPEANSLPLNQPSTLRSVTTFKSSPVRVKLCYYSDLYWHGIHELGLWKSTLNPKMAVWYNQLAPLLSECGSTNEMFNQPLQKFLYHMPTYLDPTSPDELHAHFEMIKEFIRKGSIDVFSKGNSSAARYWDRWYCDLSLKAFQASYSGREELLLRIIDVWESYMKYLWPNYESEFKRNSPELDLDGYRKSFESLQAFSFWERMLETKYPYKEFVVILCRETPALAARIGPEKIVLGTQYAQESLYNAFVHEVGIRYFEPASLVNYTSVKPFIQSDYSGVMKLVEAEICLLKMEKLPNLKDDPYVPTLRLQKLVNWRAQVFFDTTFIGYFPKLYQGAKEKSLL